MIAPEGGEPPASTTTSPSDCSMTTTLPSNGGFTPSGLSISQAWAVIAWVRRAKTCAGSVWAMAGSAAIAMTRASAASLLGRRGLHGQRHADGAGPPPGPEREDARADPDEGEAGGAERREGLTLNEAY